AFGVLVQHGQSHREMKPVQNVLSFLTHIELQIADGVAAVREKRNLLVQLEPLRLQDLVQPAFRFGVHSLHKAKAFAGGGLLVLIAYEGERTLPDNDLEVV